MGYFKNWRISIEYSSVLAGGIFPFVKCKIIAGKRTYHRTPDKRYIIITTSVKQGTMHTKRAYLVRYSGSVIFSHINGQFVDQVQCNNIEPGNEERSTSPS